MGGCKDEKLRLQADQFFEADLRPVLRGFHNGGCAGVSKRIRDESALTDSDERIGPNHEYDFNRSQAGDALLERFLAAMKFAIESFTGFGRPKTSARRRSDERISSTVCGSVP